MVNQDTANLNGQDNGNDFPAALKRHRLPENPLSVETMWVNLTRLCNQACAHCHVAASPQRTEHMEGGTINRCLEVLAENPGIRRLDVTGGAPELNPHFDYLVAEARRLGKEVVVRHNLTVAFDGHPETGEDKGYLPRFFARHGVTVLASLPHYWRRQAESLRGRGVFRKSIAGLRLLNGQGYGRKGSGRVLNLVYNHSGPLTPGQRATQEADFRRELGGRHGLVFNNLFAVTNVPINRFRSRLESEGELGAYMAGLVAAFNPDAAGSLDCRSLVSVGYDGRLYDCDFNQMLGLEIGGEQPMTIFNMDLGALLRRKIRFAAHCFGCTAGGGTS
jgi:radical SAM/Cys-rich protein